MLHRGLCTWPNGSSGRKLPKEMVGSGRHVKINGFAIGVEGVGVPVALALVETAQHRVHLCVRVDLVVVKGLIGIQACEVALRARVRARLAILADHPAFESGAHG